MSAPLLLLLPWLVAPRAQAQASQASPVDPVDEAEVPVLYRPVTELGEGDFPGLDIDGALVRPAGVYEVHAVHRPFPSWIALRTSFDPEMQASLEDIR